MGSELDGVESFEGNTVDPRIARETKFEPSSVEIDQSWRRSHLSGVHPALAVPAVRADLLENKSRFVRAARDILDRASESLADSDLSILVADASGRIVRRWSGTKRADTAMEAIGAVTGADFSEEQIGTNGLGTPLELRRQLVVNGSDHYLYSLHSYSCFGMPVLNPMTRRAEGVIDITSLDGRANPLFQPFVTQIVNAVQDELVAQSRVSEQRAFNVFREATRRSNRAVAALCGDLILTNNRASELLREADSLVLQEIASGLGFSEHRTLNIPQCTGGTLRISAHRIDGTVDGTLFDIEIIPQPSTDARSAHSRKVGSNRVKWHEHTTMLHIAGEPGSGRTTTALGEASPPLVHLKCSDAVLDERRWLARLTYELRTHTGSIVLDDIDLLSPELAGRVASCGFDRPELTLVITSAFELDDTARRLTHMCGQRIVTTPLRERKDEIVDVIAKLSDPADPYSPTAAVLSLLKSHPWPGNYTELARVLTIAASNAGSTTLTVNDLPPEYRRPAPAKAAFGDHDDDLRAQITAALTKTNGDKKAAAKALGISRTTLYTRMRRLQIY